MIVSPAMWGFFSLHFRRDKFIDRNCIQQVVNHWMQLILMKCWRQTVILSFGWRYMGKHSACTIVFFFLFCYKVELKCDKTTTNGLQKWCTTQKIDPGELHMLSWWAAPLIEVNGILGLRKGCIHLTQCPFLQVFLTFIIISFLSTRLHEFSPFMHVSYIGNSKLSVGVCVQMVFLSFNVALF